MNPFMATYKPRIYRIGANQDCLGLDEEKIKAATRPVLVIAILPDAPDEDARAVFVDLQNQHQLNSCWLQEIFGANLDQAAGITKPTETSWPTPGAP